MYWLVFTKNHKIYFERFLRFGFFWFFEKKMAPDLVRKIYTPNPLHFCRRVRYRQFWFMAPQVLQICGTSTAHIFVLWHLRCYKFMAPYPLTFLFYGTLGATNLSHPTRLHIYFVAHHPRRILSHLYCHIFFFLIRCQGVFVSTTEMFFLKWHVLKVIFWSFARATEFSVVKRFPHFLFFPRTHKTLDCCLDFQNALVRGLGLCSKVIR